MTGSPRTSGAKSFLKRRVQASTKPKIPQSQPSGCYPPEGSLPQNSSVGSINSGSTKNIGHLYEFKK